jgi:hypothetical protein
MSAKPMVGNLRVWWCPQVPCSPFHIAVANTGEAKLILRTLADYDLFQLKHRIKPDFCNAGGLEIYEADSGEGRPGWCEWYCNETGNSIDEILEAA